MKCENEKKEPVEHCVQMIENLKSQLKKVSSTLSISDATSSLLVLFKYIFRCNENSCWQAEEEEKMAKQKLAERTQELDMAQLELTAQKNQQQAMRDILVQISEPVKILQRGLSSLLCENSGEGSGATVKQETSTMRHDE